MQERSCRWFWTLVSVLIGTFILGCVIVGVRVSDLTTIRRQLADQGNEAATTSYFPWNGSFGLLQLIDAALFGETHIYSHSVIWQTGPVDDDVWQDVMPLLLRLPGVATIALQDCPVSGRSIDTFSQFPELRGVILTGTEVTDKELSGLADVPSLRSLYVLGSPVTGSGFAALGRLPNLAYLFVEDCEVSDEGVAAISALQRLEYLELSNVALGDSDLQRLEESLPSVKISDD